MKTQARIKIEKMATTDPTLYAVTQMHKRGASWESCMEAAVIALAMPASPTGDTAYPNGQVQIGDTGMTIRERMAMEAMAGNMAARTALWVECDPAFMASMAVEMADALLAELERTGGDHE